MIKHHVIDFNEIIGGNEEITVKQVADKFCSVIKNFCVDLNVHTILCGKVVETLLVGSYCRGFYPEDCYTTAVSEWHYPAINFYGADVVSCALVEENSIILIHEPKLNSGPGVFTITVSNLVV